MSLLVGTVGAVSLHTVIPLSRIDVDMRIRGFDQNLPWCWVAAFCHPGYKCGLPNLLQRLCVVIFLETSGTVIIFERLNGTIISC